MTVPTTETDDFQLRTAESESEMLELADESGIKEARLSYPSGWLLLAREGPTRALVDALRDADAGARYGTENLASMADLDADAVEDAADTLIALGVLVADEGAYRVNEYSGVRHAANELGAAVEATGAPADETGLRYLARLESVRLLLDALLTVDAGRTFTQEDFHRMTGVSRKAVWVHVERLVELSVLEEDGDEYVLAVQSPVYRWAQSLDAAVVGAALSSSHP